jgi:hypothetical protein
MISLIFLRSLNEAIRTKTFLFELFEILANQIDKYQNNTKKSKLNICLIVFS